MTDLRHAPKQGRSERTLATIRRAARTLYDDRAIGRERLTTAMVAELAHVSIGTVYRYYPDRAALIEEIELDRVTEAITRIDQTIAANEGRAMQLLWRGDEVVDLLTDIRQVLDGTWEQQQAEDRAVERAQYDHIEGDADGSD